MYKLSNRQKADLETVLYFAPKDMKEKYPPTEQDIKEFFEYSEKGLHKDKVTSLKYSNFTGFDTLIQGKRWRGIMLHEVFEPSVLEGSLPYDFLLGGEDTPRTRAWVDFFKKEMFKGVDADIIEKVYQRILQRQ